MGVLITRALLFGVDIRAPDFWKLPYVHVYVAGSGPSLGIWAAGQQAAAPARGEGGQGGSPKAGIPVVGRSVLETS